jgi:hypothetical protein
MDYAGPSSLTHEDFMDRPAPSPPTDDPAPEENHDGEVYGLSNLRQSRRIADCVEKIGQQRWKSNASVRFVNDREESEEEEEDTDDDESVRASDFDEGSEGYEEDDNELFAGPGQEGISIWDSLGEGFLREASQLGMPFWR